MSRAKQAYKFSQQARANDAAHKQATMDQGNGLLNVADILELLSQIQNTQQNSLDVQTKAFATLGINFEEFTAAALSGLQSTVTETSN